MKIYASIQFSQQTHKEKVNQSVTNTWMESQFSMHYSNKIIKLALIWKDRI